MASVGAATLAVGEQIAQPLPRVGRCFALSDLVAIDQQVLHGWVDRGAHQAVEAGRHAVVILLGRQGVNLPGDRVFDFVIAIGFWDYVADPVPRLEVIRGITSHTFLSAWPRAGTLRSAVRRVRLTAAGCPVYFWTLPEIDRMLEQAGFRRQSVEVHGQLYCVEARPAS